MQRLLLIIAILGIAFGAGLWLSASRTDPEPRVATILPATLDLPEFQLLDESGEAADRRFFEGQWDAVFFGFTHCPDICPLTLQQLSLARTQLEESGETVLPRIVLVSVDPERDTPEVLKDYTTYFGEGVKGLTGELDQLQTLTSALGIFFNRLPEDEDGAYNVDHSAVVLLIDPQARFTALFSAPHNVDTFVSDLPLLMQ